MYKNRLQQITQKSGLLLPEYEHKNEGFQHAPKFRCRVLVNGKYFESGRTFSHIIEAEQDAAKYALENIPNHVIEMVKNEGLRTSIVQDSNSYKSILIEFAVKRNLRRPEYKTDIPEGETRPVFVASLSFDGKDYEGEISKSKKEAEQMAARAAIQSLLESDSGVLQQVINSKNKTRTMFKAEHSGSNLPIVLRPDVAAVRPINILPSTANLNPVSRDINSSRENKRKRDAQPSTANLNRLSTIIDSSRVNKRQPETGNRPQKRMRGHFKI